MKDEAALLKKRLADNEREQADNERAAADVLAAYTDAAGAERDRLSKQWAALQADAELLRAERAELRRRYQAAYLRPYELAVQEAKREADALWQAANEARRRMQSVSTERLHFLNRGGRSGATPESDRLLVDMEAKHATAQAESRIASGKAERAASALQRAINDLEIARAEVA